MAKSPLYRYKELDADKRLNLTTIPTYDLTDHNWTKHEDSCMDRCRAPDCVRTNFVPTLMATSARHGEVLRNTADTTTNKTMTMTQQKTIFPLVLLAPPIPDMTYEAKPKITLIDYLTYISSCANFWLGFSPLVFFLTNGTLRKLFKGDE